MATRNTTHILKNTVIPSQSLPGTGVYMGEPLVNLGDGIMFFSGGTSGAPTWVPSNNNADYFEVGSNLYNLKIRNQITSYAGNSNIAGKFLSGTTNGFVLANISSIQGISTDTYVTGFTYSNNTITLSQNSGQPNLSVTVNTLTGLSVTNLTSGQVVYAGTSGELKTESDFTYNDSTNLLTVNNLEVTNLSGGTPVQIGQAGMVIGSGGSPSNPGVGDLLIHGSLFVYGTGTTITTNELYIEDPTITLNYNPSGSSTTTSVGSGFVIQDGSGIQGTDSSLQIGRLYNNSNLSPITEYTSYLGNSNRGFFTQLNDIIIRNTNNDPNDPDGVRVLTELDVLDGGVY